MKRVTTPVKLTLAGKLSNWFTHWQRKLRKDKALQRRLLLVAAAIVAGGIIATARLVQISQTNPLPTAPAPKTVVVATQPTPTQDLPDFSKHPTWTQDFANQSSGLLDPSDWNILVGPAENSNNEQQYYTSNLSNIKISDGALHLIATKESEPNGYKYGSARIETAGKQSFLYGRIDVTAKLPSGNGTWPAIWMLPDNDVYAKKSPAGDPLRYKNGGEIDILEAVGFEPNNIYGVAHTASDASVHPDGTGSYSTITVPGSSTEYNTYTLLWTPSSLTFAVNGLTFYTYTRPANSNYTTWPFDQPFYLIANLAVGGSWGGLHGIDDSALPGSLDIKSIYYYAYTGK